jgi:hypothetical protein
MFRIPMRQPSDDVLFEAVLEPTSSAVDRLAKQKDIGEGEITTFRGKKNKVAIGVPFFENLISRLAEEGYEVPREIRQMSEVSDFHYVSLSCSFLPDHDCRFLWARFGVELTAESTSEKLHEEIPIAYDMFPSEVTSEVKYKREAIFNPELKFSFGAIAAETKIVEVGTQKELVAYKPQMFAYGVNTPKAIWDFESTEEKGIWGNRRDLLLIVKAPRNSKVKGRFLLGAEAGFNLGKWIPIPLSKRKDRLAEVEYDLSE